MAALAVNPHHAQFSPAKRGSLQQQQELLHNSLQDVQQTGMVPGHTPHPHHSHQQSQHKGDGGGAWWSTCDVCLQWSEMLHDQRIMQCPKRLEHSQLQCPGILEITDGEIHKWVQCDLCDKWRFVEGQEAVRLDQLEEGAEWKCADMVGVPNASCSSPERLWTDEVPHPATPSPGTSQQQPTAPRQTPQRRRPAARGGASRRKGGQVETGIVIPDKLSAKCIVPEPEKCQPETIQATCPQLTTKEERVKLHSKFPEFVLGKDDYISAPKLAVGFTIKDGPDTVLSSGAIKYEDLQLFAPFVLGVLKSYQSGRLKACKDSRGSAGPLDIAEVVDQCWEEITTAIDIFKAKRAEELKVPVESLKAGYVPYVPYVLQVTSKQRGYYIGLPDEVTKHGGHRMDHNKTYEALPLRTWAGGCKVAEVVSKDKRLAFAALEKGGLGIPNEAAARASFVKAAEVVWAQLMANPHCRARGEFMLREMRDRPVQGVSRIGNTGFNSYSVNLDYRTGCHLDGKNVAGSLSALIILETGQGFQGGLYMLPQFRLALAPQQGTVIFHCSDHKDFGHHGNSEIFLPCQDSHRISVVLYQTQLKDARHVESSVARQLNIPPQVLTTAPANKQTKAVRNLLPELFGNGSREPAQAAAPTAAAAAAAVAPAAMSNGNARAATTVAAAAAGANGPPPSQSDSVIMITSSSNVSNSNGTGAPTSYETSMSWQQGAASAQPMRGGAVQSLSFLASGGAPAAATASGISVNASAAARSSAALHAGVSEQRSNLAAPGGVVHGAVGGVGGAQLLPQLLQHKTLSVESAAAAAAVAAARQGSMAQPDALTQFLQQAVMPQQPIQHPSISQDRLAALLAGGVQAAQNSSNSAAAPRLGAQNLLPPAGTGTAMYAGAHSAAADAAATCRLASSSSAVVSGGMARSVSRVAGPITEGVKRGREGAPVDALDPHLNWNASLQHLSSQIASALGPHNLNTAVAASNMHAQHASSTHAAHHQSLTPPLPTVVASQNSGAPDAVANGQNVLVQQARSLFAANHSPPGTANTPAAQQSMPEELEHLHAVLRKIQTHGYGATSSQSESCSQRELAELRRELQCELAGSSQRALQHAYHGGHPAQGGQDMHGPSSAVSRAAARESPGGVGVHSKGGPSVALAPYFSDSHAGGPFPAPAAFPEALAPSDSPPTPQTHHADAAASLQSIMHAPQSPTTPAQLTTLSSSMHAPSNTQSSGVGGAMRSAAAPAHARCRMSVSTTGSISHSTQQAQHAASQQKYDGSSPMHVAQTQSLHTHGGHASSASQNQPSGHSPTLSSTAAAQARQAQHARRAVRPQQMENAFSDVVFAAAHDSTRCTEALNGNQSIRAAAHSTVQHNAPCAPHKQQHQQASDLPGSIMSRDGKQAAKVAQFSLPEVVNALQAFQPPKDAPSPRSKARVERPAKPMTTAPQQQVMHAPHACEQKSLKRPEQLIQEALEAVGHRGGYHSPGIQLVGAATMADQVQQQKQNNSSSADHVPTSGVQDYPEGESIESLLAPKGSAVGPALHAEPCMHDMRLRGGGQLQSSATGNSVIGMSEGVNNRGSDAGGVGQQNQEQPSCARNLNSLWHPPNTQTGTTANPAAAPASAAAVAHTFATRGPSAVPNVQQAANQVHDGMLRDAGGRGVAHVRSGPHGTGGSNMGANVLPSTGGLVPGAGAAPSRALPIWLQHDKVLLMIDHEKWAALSKRT